MWKWIGICALGDYSRVQSQTEFVYLGSLGIGGEATTANPKEPIFELIST